MQGLKRYPNDVVQLDLTSPSSSNTTNSMPTNLSIDAEESTETKIQRLISEHPVIIFSRSSCCMCHVMRKLLASIGVQPTVIELDDHEISALPPSNHDNGDSPRNPSAPAVFIGGTCIGGLESLFALHLSGHLVPKLVEVGVLWEKIRNPWAWYDPDYDEAKLQYQISCSDNILPIIERNLRLIHCAFYFILLFDVLGIFISLLSKSL